MTSVAPPGENYVNFLLCVGAID